MDVIVSLARAQAGRPHKNTLAYGLGDTGVSLDRFFGIQPGITNAVDIRGGGPVMRAGFRPRTHAVPLMGRRTITSVGTDVYRCVYTNAEFLEITREHTDGTWHVNWRMAEKEAGLTAVDGDQFRECEVIGEVPVLCLFPGGDLVEKTWKLVGRPM